LLAICFAPSLADLTIFLTLTQLVVVIIFENFSFALFTPPSRRLSESTLEEEIRKGQESDEKIKEIKTLIISLGKAPDFIEDEQGIVWFKERIYVPEIEHLHQLTLREAHDPTYSIHLGSTKMYQDLKEKYWWYGLKRDVATHVALCDVCQRVKAEHQRLAGLLQPLMVPE
jgi:hypothetical protein